MLNPDFKRCRICGLSQPEPTRGADGTTPSFDICDCCGVEFGYEDTTEAGIESYRDEWLREGAPWRSMHKPPEDFSAETNLATIGIDLASAHAAASAKHHAG